MEDFPFKNLKKLKKFKTFDFTYVEIKLVLPTPEVPKVMTIIV